MQYTTVLVSTALLVSAAAAAPATTAPSPASPSPSFDGAPLGRATVTAIHAAAGELAPLVAWSACRDEAGAVDQCLILTVSSGWYARSYVLTDLRCPAGAGAGACYGGYVVGLATSTRTRATASSGGVDVEQTTGVRFGRTIALWPASALSMPTTDDFTAVGRTSFVGGSKRYTWTLTDRTGAEIATDGLSVYAASSLTCADIGEGAGHFASWIGVRGANGVGAGIAAAGIFTGLEVSGLGTVATAGVASLPAGGVGLALAGLGISAGSSARSALMDEVEPNAKLIETAVREGCEWLEAVDEFQPEEIDLQGDPYGQQAGGATVDSSDLDAVKCDGAWEGGVCYEDGTETYAQCEQDWVAGECKWFCVETCLSGC